jgi:hypothetical protein
MIMDSLLQECEGMVSGRLSFNLGDDYTNFDALDRLSIKNLYPAGLLGTQRKGQNVECWIGPESVKDLASFFPSKVPNQDIS